MRLDVYVSHGTWGRFATGLTNRGRLQTGPTFRQALLAQEAPCDAQELAVQPGNHRRNAAMVCAIVAQQAATLNG